MKRFIVLQFGDLNHRLRQNKNELCQDIKVKNRKVKISGLWGKILFATEHDCKKKEID